MLPKGLPNLQNIQHNFQTLSLTPAWLHLDRRKLGPSEMTLLKPLYHKTEITLFQVWYTSLKNINYIIYWNSNVSRVILRWYFYSPGILGSTMCRTRYGRYLHANKQITICKILLVPQHRITRADPITWAITFTISCSCRSHEILPMVADFVTFYTRT